MPARLIVFFYRHCIVIVDPLEVSAQRVSSQGMNAIADLKRLVRDRYLELAVREVPAWDARHLRRYLSR